MSSKLDEELERLSKAATQGVWRYRPDQYDDWGIVKSPVATDGFACVLAQFRDPNALDNETLARHRESKTDPWEANARFVTTLVNAYRTGQLILAQPIGDEVEAVRQAIWDTLRKGMPQQKVPKTRTDVTAIATAAITTYEAVSGVAKMRDALREARSGLCAFTGGPDGACSETIARIDAALGEKP